MNGVNTKKVLGAGVLGGAMIGLALVAGTRWAGRRTRTSQSPLDEELIPPSDLIHHHVPTRDGGSVHVVDSGEPSRPGGRPVVLLHGVTLQWWVWSALIKRLRECHRVVAWDMRGHGASVAGTEGVTLEAAASDLAAVLEHLSLRDVIVIGHSMGGMVLGRFAVQHPDELHGRCAGAVFLATSGAPVSINGLAGGLAALSTLVGRITETTIRHPRLQYHWNDTNVAALLVRGAFGRSASGRMVDDVRRMLAETNPTTLAQAGASISAHDVCGELAHVEVPTVVVVGTQDRLTPPAHAEMLAESIPGAELVVLPGIGHQVMQEDPAALCRVVEQLESRIDQRQVTSRTAS